MPASTKPLNSPRQNYTPETRAHIIEYARRHPTNRAIAGELYRITGRHVAQSTYTTWLLDSCVSIREIKKSTRSNPPKSKKPTKKRSRARASKRPRPSGRTKPSGRPPRAASPLLSPDVLPLLDWDDDEGLILLGHIRSPTAGPVEEPAAACEPQPVDQPEELGSTPLPVSLAETNPDSPSDVSAFVAQILSNEMSTLGQTSQNVAPIFPLDSPQNPCPSICNPACCSASPASASSPNNPISLPALPTLHIETSFLSLPENSCLTSPQILYPDLALHSDSSLLLSPHAQSSPICIPGHSLHPSYPPQPWDSTILPTSPLSPSTPSSYHSPLAPCASQCSPSAYAPCLSLPPLGSPAPQDAPHDCGSPSFISFLFTDEQFHSLQFLKR